jgi:urease accessory protein
MTVTTSTRQPDDATSQIDRSGTTVRVALDPRGRVAVHTTTSGGEGRPRLRPVLLSSTATTARVCLVPEGALLLAGDVIELRIEVGAGAALELVEAGGTVAYNMRGQDARWDVDVVVEAGAALLWAGEPFVVAAGAVVSRRTRVRLGATARVALREVLVLGRHGEPGGRLRQRLEVTDCTGAPVLVEDLSLGECPAFGILGHRRVVASVLALGLDVPGSVTPEHRYDLERGGTLFRSLGDEVHRTIPKEAWAAATAGCRR